MTSPLERIKVRMAETRERETLDVVVPGDNYEGLVHVRYARKIPQDEVLAIARKADKGSQVVGNLQFLADSCVGVWVADGDDKYGFNEESSTDPAEWPTFDRSLAEMLPDGVEGRVTDIAHAFFAAGFPAAPRPEDDDRMIRAEGSITRHAKKLREFYGYGDQESEGK